MDPSGVVTAVTGTPNYVNVSTSGGVATVTLPQRVDPAASPNFNRATATQLVPVAPNELTTKSYVDTASAYVAGAGLTLNTKTFALEAPVSVANGGTALSAAPLAGQLLVGNGTGYTLNTITAGAGITVTNGIGSVTIGNNGVTSVVGTPNRVVVTSSGGAYTLSTPQNLDTTASVQFD